MYAGRGADPHTQSAKLTPSQSTDSTGLPAEPQQPFHGSRGSEPGHRGCWALNTRGDPCGAARRGDSDFCNAHSGVGVAANPKGFAAKGLEAANRNRRRRADLRIALGVTRPNSPRGLLKLAVNREAERLAWRAVDAALDPSVPSEKAIPAVLSLIEAVDPQAQIELSTALPEGGVKAMSLDELVSFAEANGIPLPSVDGSTEPLTIEGVAS